MIELSTWAGLEPAVMDIKTVSGLAQVFELTLTDSAGSEVDLEGVTFRGAVNMAPLKELMCSVEGGKVLFGWSGLPAGRHSFDLFLVTGNVEKALVRGVFVVSGRVMPPLDQESYSVNHAATLVLPDSMDGIILVELSEVGLVDLLSRRAGAFASEAKEHVFSIRELKEFIVEKVDGFGDVVETATNAITEVKDSAVELVETARNEAVHAANDARTDAETATNAAGVATGASATATERAKEAEGYAGFAHASETAAANSETAAATSAANAARDAKNVHNNKTAMESLASAWPQTVSNAEQTIVAAKEDALSSIQTKQADSVLAVGRASQTAQQNITGAKTEAVTAVQTAKENAVGTITPLVQRAETAQEAVTASEGRINTAAANASASATNAAAAATEAQQALEAIPQVDAAGNMTLSGGLTAAGVINANGGVNIPLAVGAPTDTAAVNRLYAAGLGGVMNIYTFNYFLNTDSITATGTAQTIVLVAGLYARVNVLANTHSTIVCAFTGPVGQWNYSSFAGFAIPWQLTSAGKLTVGIGRGSRTVRKDLTLDSYSIIPGNELAYNTGEILDITFDNARDTARGGYVVRVREIYAAATALKWMVKTTTSFIPATQNEPIPFIVNKVIYHQYAPRSYNAGDYGDAYGSLYLLTGGGSSQQLWKIAAVRGVSTFETGTGFNTIVTDIPGISGSSGSVFVGAAERINYQPGNINPVYYALEALAGNAIETEETADFVDINTPIE